MTQRAERAVSLTELLVVVSVMMILASFLIVGTSEAYTRAHQVTCQNNLHRTWEACLIFHNRNHSRYPKAWNNVGKNGAKLRWYDAIADYLDSQDVIRCPLAEQTDGSNNDERMNLPIYYCNYGAARRDRCFYQWMHFISSRDWMTNDPEPLYPYDPNGLLFPYQVRTNPDQWGYAGPDLADGSLEGYSQVWLIGDLHERHDLPTDAELAALAALLQERGGVHLWVSGPQYNHVPTRVLAALGVPVQSVGTTAAATNYTATEHEVMTGVARLGQAAAWPPADLTVSGAAKIVGTRPNGKPGVVVYDGGVGRVVVNHALDSIMCYLGKYDYCTDSFDYKQYAVNAAKWLYGGFKSAGACSYGYNNLLGFSPATLDGNTVVMMDYQDWEIDHDGKGSDHDANYVATRHHGKANVCFADGRVKALAPEEIREGMWTPERGD